MKKIFTLLALALVLASCGETPETKKISETTNKKEVTTKTPEKTETKKEKIMITTSILPLASITNTVGGEFVEVKNMVGAGQSPHSFDLKTSHLVDVENSKAIVMVGMDHIDGFLDSSLEGKNTLKLVEGMELIEMEAHEHEHGHEDEEEHSHEEENHEDEHENEHHDEDHEDTHEGEEHDHEHNEEHHEHGAHEQDPHIWNSPKNASVLAQKIATFLSKLHPEHQAVFEKDAQEFTTKLSTLVTNFRKNTAGKKQQYFIVFHDAHNYLLRDLGIDADKKLVFRKSVLSDPNSRDMKELIDEIQEHGVKIAFVEPQFKNTNFEKLAKKYNIAVFALDPLGTDESAEGYVQNTENNLKSLEKIFK